MTGAELQTMFEELVDDSMDETQFLIFLNAAKNEIEAEREWNFNRAFDNTKSVATGDTYLTAKALPTRFLMPRKLYFSDDISPLLIIPFEERERYKDIYKRWYIDWANSNFHICGSSGAVGKTLNLYYGQSTADITLSTSPVWPSMFHPLIGFKAAEMWASGSDGDDLNFKMSRENLRLATNLKKSMILWDAKIKTMEYNDRNAQRADLSSYPNVVGGEFIA
jgi:hypothetical protein